MALGLSPIRRPVGVTCPEAHTQSGLTLYCGTPLLLPPSAAATGQFGCFEKSTSICLGGKWPRSAGP